MGVDTTRGWVLAVVAIVFVASGCASSPRSDGSSTATSEHPAADVASSTTTTAVPDGMRRYVGEGYSLLLPADWVVVPASEVDFSIDLRLDSAFLREQVAQSPPGQYGEIVVYHPDIDAGVSVFRSLWVPYAINVMASNMRRFELRSGSTDISTDVFEVPAGEVIILRYTYEGEEGIYGYLRTEFSSWNFWAWPRGFVDELEAPLVAMIESLVETYRPSPPTTVASPTTASPTTTRGSTTTTTLVLPTTAGSLLQHDGDGFSVLLPSAWTVFGRHDWQDVVAGLPEAEAEVAIGLAGSFFADGGAAIAIDVASGDRVGIAEEPVILLSAEGYEYEIQQELELQGAVFTTEIRRLRSGVRAVVVVEPVEGDRVRWTATVLDPARSWVIEFEGPDDEAFLALFGAILDSFVDTIA